MALLLWLKLAAGLSSGRGRARPSPLRRQAPLRDVYDWWNEAEIDPAAGPGQREQSGFAVTVALRPHLHFCDPHFFGKGVEPIAAPAVSHATLPLPPLQRRAPPPGAMGLRPGLTAGAFFRRWQAWSGRIEVAGMVASRDYRSTLVKTSRFRGNGPALAPAAEQGADGGGELGGRVGLRQEGEVACVGADAIDAGPDP